MTEARWYSVVRTPPRPQIPAYAGMTGGGEGIQREGGGEIYNHKSKICNLRLTVSARGC